MQAAAAARTRVEPATPKVETEYDYNEVVRPLFAAEPATPTTTPAAERGNSHQPSASSRTKTRRRKTTGAGGEHNRLLTEKNKARRERGHAGAKAKLPGDGERNRLLTERNKIKARRESRQR